MTHNPVLFAYNFDGSGGGERIADEDINGCAQDTSQTTWVHLDGNSDAAAAWLRTYAPHIDALTIDALLAVETRPCYLEAGDNAALILRGVNLNEGAHVADMISIRIWTGENRIFTIGLRPLKTVADMQESFEKRKGAKNTAEFLTMLISRLFERMEPTILSLDEDTDDIEEHILESPSIDNRKDVVELRKTAIILRRYILPQKEALNSLLLSKVSWMDEDDERYIRENLNRLTRYIEDLDAIRERAQIVKDELANLLADRMNKNMYVLSVVAALFLPLGFLTGLLGINVGGMPGAENGMAFWFVCLLCLVCAFGIAGAFKLLKWI